MFGRSGMARPGSASRHTLIWVLAGVTLLAAVVVALIAAQSAQSGKPTLAGTTTSGATASLEAPSGTGAPQATTTSVAVPASGATAPAADDGVPPAATAAPDELSDLLPPRSGAFAIGTVTADPGPVAAGAVDAATTTYGNGQASIDVAASSWADPAAATDAAQQAIAQAGFDPAQPAAGGDVGVPAIGEYWYFERDGVGHVFFTSGVGAVHASGDPYWVQEFFAQYPRPV